MILDSVIYFIFIGLAVSRWKNLRMFFMMVSILPPFAGFMGISLLPNDPAHKWTKWGCYFITVPYVIALFLAWSLIPSNIAGRTKRTITSSWSFVGYCVGNMCGSQIFKAKDAPKYTNGTIGCAVCFGLEFLLLVTWRLTLVRRNRRRDRQMREQGISEEERVRRGKELGEQDYTDFENPYVSVPSCSNHPTYAHTSCTVSLLHVEYHRLRSSTFECIRYALFRIEVPILQSN